MPATFDKILGKPLLHSHSASDIIGLGGNTISQINSDQILNSNSADILLVDASTNPIFLTLPDLSTANAKTFNIKKIDNSDNLVSIIPYNNDKIENLSENLVIEFTNSTVQLMATVNSWFII